MGKGTIRATSVARRSRRGDGDVHLLEPLPGDGLYRLAGGGRGARLLGARAGSRLERLGARAETGGWMADFEGAHRAGGVGGLRLRGALWGTTSLGLTHEDPDPHYLADGV